MIKKKTGWVKGGCYGERMKEDAMERLVKVDKRERGGN